MLAVQPPAGPALITHHAHPDDPDGEAITLRFVRAPLAEVRTQAKSEIPLDTDAAAS